jgi:hypothetical protein
VRLWPEPASLAAARLQRDDPARDDAIRAEVSGLVVNPQDLARYAPHSRAGKAIASTTFSPSQLPSLEGSPVRMLILTRDVLANAFEAYADDRTGAGIPTVVRTVEWVEQNYPHGADLQETLRSFIREAYELWGIDTVLLGGDSDVIPARYAYSTYAPTPDEVPTDLYYACLDGGWNDDGDAHWGEAYMDVSDPGDNADLFPELYIGRLPVHNDAEIDAYRAKHDDYVRPQVTDYQNKMLWLSEVLWPANYNPGGTIYKNGADNSERIISLNDLNDGSKLLTRLYETTSNYPGSLALTRQAAIDEMNAGHGLVTHIGHGFRYTMSMGDLSLTNLQANALTNAQRPFVLVMLNCTAAAFDFPCLAEQFILNPNGGAVGVIGAAREAYPDGSQFYLEAWFEKLVDDPLTTVARALHEARLKYVANTFNDTVFRWTNFITTYLGDPTLRAWSEVPLQPSVTHAASVPLGTQAYTVQVERTGVPVAGATVSLWMKGQFYSVGTTDLAGEATLDIRPEAAGTADLYVSGPAIVPYAAGVTLQPHGGVALRVTGSVQIDDSGAGTLGNGNGRLEAGEQADLVLNVANEGQTTATNVAITLSTTDPFVQLPTPSVAIGTLAAGESVAAAGIRVEVSSLPPDQHHVEFDVVLTADWASICCRSHRSSWACVSTIPTSTELRTRAKPTISWFPSRTTALHRSTARTPR